MPSGDADRIRQHLSRQVQEARDAGSASVTFRAGDVHDALQLPGRMPNVCQVLEGKKFQAMAGVEFKRYVHRPPSGQGANLKIEFGVLKELAMIAGAAIGTQERYVTSDGARLWTTVSGQGAPVLLFNGGPGCHDYLGPVADLVSDVCQVVRFEARGCGRSDWDGRYDLDTLLTDADAIRRSYGMERCIVAGHSFGANAALAFALRYPSHVTGLIGFAGGNVLNDRSWSMAFHRRLKGAGEILRGHEYHADEKVNLDGNRSWREFIRQPAMFREIADLDTPAIFINGSRDFRPNWPTRQLAALLPQGTFVEIPGAPHNIWNTHAAELEQELRNAVQRISRHRQNRNGAANRQKAQMAEQSLIGGP